MSIKKETLIIPQQNIWHPTEKKVDNEKINHIHHKLTALFKELQNNSCDCSNISKYDLVCKSIDEAIMLIQYREMKSDKMKQRMKKIKNTIRSLI